MDKNKARVARWLTSLDPSTKQTLLDLNLEAGDLLPDEFVSGLKDYKIHPAEWVGSLGYIVPGELIELLDEQRGQNP
ncbi:hypothetical protein PV735_31505 [Streptomyces turgidiscabies]|uniref:hypothetical protein n=1 Tax=Streptomyces turgidiscabies TaxID=85558 RepID=UPI0029AA6615|nr:hypothetical protein [Streptomyces turgidiscabies]MDX3497178.1 hypothetical protein [Streptomyces turgidiscabies]